MDLIMAIPAAVGLGALHSLEPGHGKGVISAYLIARRGRAKDAILLGAISAFTHTITIAVLSFAAAGFLQQVASDRWMSWIELSAGFFITWIGAAMLFNYFNPKPVTLGRLSKKGLQTMHADHAEDHHGHLHLKGHSHNHSNAGGSDAPRSLWQLTSVGLLTGIIPCPSAIAILLASLTAHRAAAGLTLVGAFSLGSAVTMSVIGILVVRAGDSFQRRETITLARSLSLFSSMLILGLGFFVTLKSAMGL